MYDILFPKTSLDIWYYGETRPWFIVKKDKLQPVNKAVFITYSSQDVLYFFPSNMHYPLSLCPL